MRAVRIGRMLGRQAQTMPIFSSTTVHMAKETRFPEEMDQWSPTGN